MRIFDQLRPPPTAAEAERMVRALYESSQLVEGYAGAGETLDDLETELADRHVPPGSRVLDLGCGAGREAFGLARRGCEVTGVDLSVPLVDRARARGLAGTAFIAGSATSVEFAAESFDALWMSSELYAEIPGRSVRIATLRRLATFVRRGGPLIVFVAFGRGRRPTRWLLDAPRRVLAPILPRLCAEPGDRILRDPLAAGAPYYRHHFESEAEVRAELEAGGLRVKDRIASAFVLRA
jgi:SAM-dependent methyltransferase